MSEQLNALSPYTAATVVNLVKRGTNFTIYEFTESKEGDRYLLKTITKNNFDPKCRLHLNTEFDILQHLKAVDSARKVYEKTEYQGTPALLLEYIDGKPLNEAYRFPISVRDFLKVTPALAKAVGQLHQQKVIHKDLQPANILVDQHTGSIRIIDFGVASRLSSENNTMRSLRLLEGHLSYIAPEQTGRMNRLVDYRADLYSLGIVFYEMLTGKCPFTAIDPLALIHSHIAVAPDLSGVPESLRPILAKLLEKSADDRYQSAFGLLHDLEQCAEQLTGQDRITPFPLGQKDYSHHFHLSQKLYGRTAEITGLIGYFNKISQGGSHLLLVSGYSGIGKSALVHEVHKPITEKSGFFISGKYDQYQRNIPYVAFLKAFEGLVQQLLTESEERRASWKDQLLAAIGSNGQIMIDVIPELELLIGAQSPVAALLPTEAQNRFFNTFLNFIGVFAQKEHPLVLFLDDLQWADAASLKLLSNLLLEDRVQHLLVIGAYRDNEVTATSPLMLTLSELGKETANISTIQLQPLPLVEVNQLVADSLRCPVAESADLSSLIFHKTAGNPFFLTQFLAKLQEDELVKFDFTNFRWHWDTAAILAEKVSANVVDLMTQKIRRLPAKTVNLLQIAACVGASFDLGTLAAAAGLPEQEVVRDLWPGIREGLIPPLDDNYRAFQSENEATDPHAFDLTDLNPRYRFLHDRIQQAAYHMIPEQERPAMHLHIGKLLLREMSPAMLDDRLFDVVNHLGLGRHLTTDPAQKTRYAELFLLAGKKAKAATANASAANYLAFGIELLEDAVWKSDQHQLAYDLHYERAEALYLSGQHAEAEKVLETILGNATLRVDLAKVYLLKGVLYTNIGQLMDAFNALKAGLLLYGIEVPATVTPEMIGQGLGEIEGLRAGRPINELIDLPLLTDPDAYMRTILLSVIATPAYFMYNDTIWVWVIMQLVKISMQDGNSDISDLGYSAFGVLVAHGLGDYSSGYAYGKLSLDLNKKFNKVENRAKVNLIFGQMTSHWRAPYRQNIPLAVEGFQYGQETGDLIYSGYNAYSLMWTYFMIGKPLQEVVQECLKFRPFFARTKDLMGQGILVLQRLSEALMGLTTRPTSLEHEGLSEEELIASMQDYPLQLPMHVYYLAKMRLHYHFGEPEQALTYVAPAKSVQHASTGYVYYPDLNFLHSLALLDIAAQADESTRIALLETVSQNQVQMKIWADNAPDNFLHKYHLVEAGLLCFQADNRRTSDEYDEAIRLANLNGFLQDEALANELAGRFFLAINKTKLARPYIQDAFTLYLKWGAAAKANQIRDLYPDHLSEIIRRGAMQIGVGKTTQGESSEALDLYSIVKAYTAISSEVAIDKLLLRMIPLILENAGAQRAVMIRVDDYGTITIVAEGTLETQALYLESNQIPIAEAEHLLPAALVQYVALTKAEVVLDNAIRDDRFGNSPYIKNKHPKSVLCLPVLHQGKVMGIIFLENNLIAAAFTSDRVEVVQLLSAQMAVSMENALWYRSLEEKVEERTRIISQQKEVIELEKQKSEKLLFNILPVTIAEELRDNGFATPKSFDSVTVLFTDFLGFTQVAAQITPKELIKTLNECFSAFDEIAIRHNLEPIKTIGDAYMCAGGVPDANLSHAADAVKAGLEIQAFARAWNQRRLDNGEASLDLRVGIHTGPVVAGVVGIRKFAYDIWGDAVNVAARMESSGEAGKINISGGTYALVKDQFVCIHRGKIEAKNKGMIDMYFVSGKR